MSNIESKQSASAFSYAQAAKGRAAASAAATLSSQETSGTTTPSRDVSFTSEAKVDFTTVGGSSEAGNTNGGGVKITGTDKETYKFNANIPASISPSIPTSPRHGSMSPKEETISASQLSTDWREGRPKQSENSERRDRDGDRKKRKSKKKEVSEEPEPEEPKPVELLVAAPPPVVNIWQQRMGAQVPKKPVVVEAILVPALAESTSEAKTEKVKTKSKGAADAERPVDLRSQAPKKDGSIAKDESKRTAARGSRQNEKDDKAVSPQLPPPVEDSTSWPTPDIAIEKIKAQEKAEKEEKAAEASSADKQPRPKQAWVTVPYTPSTIFSTPLPGAGRGPRGDRGRGGRERGPGREGAGGRAGQSSGAGEKSIISASTNATPDTRERGRNSVSSGRASSLPVDASKRTADFTNRDPRKPFERPAAASQAEPSASLHASPSSVTTQSLAPSTAPVVQTPTFQQSEHSNGVFGDAHGHPQAQQQEFRPELNARSAEFHKDAAGHHGYQTTRGRGGGHRGRGNHNFTNGGGQHNMNATGQAQQPMNGFVMRPNGYSPPQSQQYAGGFSQRARGTPGRSGSMTATPVYQQRYPGSLVGAPGMEPLQTNNIMYGYAPVMQPMSAMPFNQYAEHYSVVPLIVVQLEYYFSIDNLCKDVYLRKHMDSQGFVFLTFIAGFKRIQSLMNGDFGLLKIACEQSRIVELVIGYDGVAGDDGVIGHDRIRRAEGWDKWIMPMEDRDESAKNAGPAHFYRQQTQPFPQYPGMMQMPQGLQGMQHPQMYQNGVQNFHGYPVQHLGQMNGQENGYAPQHESPLTASAPEFAPEHSQPHIFNLADYADAEITFADEEIPKLTVVYTEKAVNEPKSRPPFVNASQRTFSNGSIDARLISEELDEIARRQASLSNGGSEASDISPERLRSLGISPKATMSPTRLVFGQAPPVMWHKEEPQTSDSNLKRRNEPYNEIRLRALNNRETGENDLDMKVMYHFWAHFLVRNFNPRMYEEFRRLAYDDLSSGRGGFGVALLGTYYDQVLNSKRRPIPATLARHYVELVKGEDGRGERAAFGKLRQSWRNGALDMRSRKKIDGFVDGVLREELER